MEEATAVSRIKLGTFRRTVLTKAQMVVLVAVAMDPFRANQESTTAVEPEPLGRATEVATRAIGLRVVVVVVLAQRAEPRSKAAVVEPAFRVQSPVFRLNTLLAVRLALAPLQDPLALRRVRAVAGQGASATTVRTAVLA